MEIVKESLAKALQNSSYNLTGYDAHIAGPPSIMPPILKYITSKGIKDERIKVDSFDG